MALPIDASEVAKHTSSTDVWIILHNAVYNVTPLLTSHPGGPSAILRNAGRDATEVFDAIHPSSTLEELKPYLLGPTAPSETAPSPPQEKKVKTLDLPPLHHQLNVDDFERTAKKVLSRKAWAYYSSASESLHTLRLNREVFSRISTPLPIFISPTAAARLAHPLGESAICSAAGKAGIIMVVSNNASQTVEEISRARSHPEQKLWWQLYIQSDRAKSAAMLGRISAPGMGYAAVVLTLDAPIPGKREADERAGFDTTARWDPDEIAGVSGEEGGVGRQLFAGTAADLEWEETVGWVKQHTHLPVVLKGVQTAEDVARAAKTEGVEGVVLSNHGGRALDTAPPAVLVLLEVRRYCPWVLEKRGFEIFMDGGVRRGGDVVKCLSLGARGVGVGRPVLWGLGGYGERGVGRVLDILGNEIETGMGLCGAKNVLELSPTMVNTGRVKGWVWDGEGMGNEDREVLRDPRESQGELVKSKL